MEVRCCRENHQAELCEYLREYHTGKDKAVHSRELERLFCMDDRTIRRKISKLRQAGCPICSDAAGYYYASDQEEINATVGRLNELITKVSNARTGLLYAPNPESSEQYTVEVKITIRQEGKRIAKEI